MIWILAAVMVVAIEGTGLAQQPSIPGPQRLAPLVQIVRLTGDQYSGFKESCVLVYKNGQYHRELRQQTSSANRPSGGWNPVEVSESKLTSTDLETLNTLVESTEFQAVTGTLGDPDLSGRLVFGLPSVVPHDIINILAASVPRPERAQVFEVFLPSGHLELPLKSFVKWVDALERQHPTPMVGGQANNCGISQSNGTPPLWEPQTTHPKLIFRAEPNSGFDDRKLRTDRKVRVSAIVNVDGSVAPVAVIHGINPVLDQEALDTVKKWKFEPALLVGFPIAMRLNVEVTFHSR